MGLVGKRIEIQTALCLVDGVTGYEYRPATPVPGDAWPLWGGNERETGGFAATWRVRVLLPQDEQLASQWVDGHLDALCDALSPVGYVERFEPMALPAGGGDQYAVEITMRSE